jgi:hypothetical protein
MNNQDFYKYLASNNLYGVLNQALALQNKTGSFASAVSFVGAPIVNNPPPDPPPRTAWDIVNMDDKCTINFDVPVESNVYYLDSNGPLYTGMSFYNSLTRLLKKANDDYFCICFNMTYTFSIMDHYPNMPLINFGIQEGMYEDWDSLGSHAASFLYDDSVTPNVFQYCATVGDLMGSPPTWMFPYGNFVCKIPYPYNQFNCNFIKLTNSLMGPKYSDFHGNEKWTRYCLFGDIPNKKLYCRIAYEDVEVESNWHYDEFETTESELYFGVGCAINTDEWQCSDQYNIGITTLDFDEGERYWLNSFFV